MFPGSFSARYSRYLYSRKRRTLRSISRWPLIATYKCYLCRGMAIDPVESCKMQHLMCQTCHLTVLYTGNSECWCGHPLFRVPSIERNAIVKAGIDRILQE